MKYVITAFSKLSLKREVISAPMAKDKALEKKNRLLATRKRVWLRPRVEPAIEQLDLFKE